MAGGRGSVGCRSGGGFGHLGTDGEAKSGLVRRLRCDRGGDSIGGVCARLTGKVFFPESRHCGVRVLPVGNGQDRLDGGDADRRAKAGFGAELAGNAGRPGGDNEGGLVGGDVRAPAPINIETSNGMAAENAAEHGQTAGEYIVHHLTHCKQEPANVRSDGLQFDSLFFSILLGVMGCLLWLESRAQGHLRRSRPLPGGRRILVEMVDRRPRASCTTPRAASSSPRWR
jgi:hypothetical protein